MNWFEKILERKDTPDDSRELKKGEVKELLSSSFGATLPDFEFISYKNSTYFFQRTRIFKGLELYETLNIIFALKDKMFSCSITSTINKSYLFSSSYNNGFLTGNTDLLAIKSGSGISNIEDSYYWHNGRIRTVEKVIKQITQDFHDFGLKYLDNRFRRLETSALVQFGFDFILNLTLDKDEFRKEIEKERKDADWVTSRIKHPVFTELRGKLQKIPNQTREDRQKISRLTFELVELYCGGY